MQTQDKIFIPETVWPCWAYALKRIGKSECLTEDWIYNKMPTLLEKFKPTSTLRSGDLLVWKNRTPQCIASPVGFIGERLVWSIIKYEYHAGVYEGCIKDTLLVSDMVVNGGSDAIPFVIRMRLLSEISTPDFVLRYSDD